MKLEVHQNTCKISRMLRSPHCFPSGARSAWSDCWRFKIQDREGNLGTLHPMRDTHSEEQISYQSQITDHPKYRSYIAITTCRWFHHFIIYFVNVFLKILKQLKHYKIHQQILPTISALSAASDGLCCDNGSGFYGWRILQDLVELNEKLTDLDPPPALPPLEPSQAGRQSLCVVQVITDNRAIVPLENSSCEEILETQNSLRQCSVILQG